MTGSRAQAIDVTVQQEADRDTTSSVPVYESDGETRIGSFTIG